MTLVEIRALLRSATIDRRRRNYERAAQSLDAAAPLIDSVDEPVSAASLRSTLFYERGYISYLIGNVQQSIAWLNGSADEASKAGNEISEAMSRVVAGYVATIGALASVDDLDPLQVKSLLALEEYVRTLVDSDTIFRRSLADDPENVRVRSWTLNSLWNQIEAAFWKGDRDWAVELYAERANIVRIAGVDTLYEEGLLALARVYMLEGNVKEACEKFDMHMEEQKKIGSLADREAGAYLCWQYAAFLERAGRRIEAQVVLGELLTYPDDLANWAWKPKAMRRLSSHAE